MSSQESLTYVSAGVSIDAGNDFVERIKSSVASTARPGADAQIGGFGGELDLSQTEYDRPILVGAIDGVGTKLMIAQATHRHRGVGIDLVAMNVNDLVVQGAEPLMFLDYYGCSKLDLAAAADFVDGVAEGCRQAGCALVGGETAEMPGMYKDKDYDAAGAAVGAVSRANRLPRLDDMVEGDVLLGLGSSGVHSNGFSLVRRIVDAAGLGWSDPAPWEAQQGSSDSKSKSSTTTATVTVGEGLLTPTRIYVKSLLPLVKGRLIKGMAHITGGGLVDNVPRMLPAHLAGEINVRAWQVPPVFRWLRKAGNVAPLEMCRTFNNGIGMVIVVSAEDADKVEQQLAGEGVVRVGKLVKREQGSAGCELLNLCDDVWAFSLDSNCSGFRSDGSG